MTDFDKTEETSEDQLLFENDFLEEDLPIDSHVEESDESEDQSISLFLIFVGFIGLLVVLIGLIFAQEMINPRLSEGSKSLGEATAGPKVLKVLNSSQDLPKVKVDSWELVLVGPKNISDELSPELSDVEGVLVDSRIADATRSFLEAARTIDFNVHLVTGYRSLEEQAFMYETFVAQEMEARQIGYEAASSFVQDYFQAPGTSEHMTGLAIDISTVDYVNLMDPSITSQLAEIAPDYGFVLRYKEAYQPQTEVAVEDWHFRYVGVDSARYMTDYDVSLETYLIQLKHRTN